MGIWDIYDIIYRLSIDDPHEIPIPSTGSQVTHRPRKATWGGPGTWGRPGAGSPGVQRKS